MKKDVGAMEIEEAIKVLTNEGYIKWCQNKPLEPEDYKEGEKESDGR